MSHRTISLICSVVLVVVNLGFLYMIAGCPNVLMRKLFPGLNVGILLFGLIITFAVMLTWFYVVVVNRKERSNG